MVMTKRSVAVFGPAYLDRVLRVDQPLVDALPAADPIDQSVEGALTFAPDRGLRLVDPGGFSLEIELPSEWPGPIGTVELDRSIHVGARGGAACKACRGTMTLEEWVLDSQPHWTVRLRVPWALLPTRPARQFSTGLRSTRSSTIQSGSPTEPPTGRY